MGATLGNIAEGLLTRNPHWYGRMTYEQKVINFNMLLADGNYLDTMDMIVRPIPRKFWHELGEDGIPVISQLHEQRMQEYGVPCTR